MRSKTPQRRTITVPSRAEVPVEATWDLGLLFPTEEDYRTKLDDVRARFVGYHNFASRLSHSPESLAEYLEFNESLGRDLERLSHYASLKKAENGSDQFNLARWAELRSLGTQISEARSFAVPEIQKLTEDRFTELMQSPLLRPWKIYLDRLRRYRPHTLSAGEERLLALAGSTLSGYKEIFSQLTHADMKFGTLTTNHGEKIGLTLGLADSLLANPDRGTRRRAFHQLYRQIENHQFTLAAALAASVRTDVFYARSRRYPSALAAALFPDNIPVAVYDNLIATVRRHLPIVHQYYALRRDFFRNKLYYYDTFIPVAPDIRVHTRFNEAIDLICASVVPLGSEYADELRTGFNSRWIDRYETQGKRTGSFSSSSYGNPPFVLVNYRIDTISSVFSVAHEVGHSMHIWLSQNSQPYRYYKPPVLLAEVAAMLNEELLTEFWLNQTNDPRIQAFLIDRSLERLRSALVRQTMFAEFEKTIHEAEEAGHGLTPEFFRATYRTLLKDYLGPPITIDRELELECFRIPHFYTAFYAYRYAIGLSAAMQLARKILSGNPEPKRRYHELLRSGCIKFPIDALFDAGIDLQSSDPVTSAMDIFARRLTTLAERLAVLGKADPNRQ